MGSVLQEICDIGYSPHDIITTFFRVVKLSPELPEFLKLEFIRVRLLTHLQSRTYKPSDISLAADSSAKIIASVEHGRVVQYSVQAAAVLQCSICPCKHLLQAAWHGWRKFDFLQASEMGCTACK